MKKLFALTALASAMTLVGCGGGGDIDIDARNQADNSVGDNSNNVVNEGGGNGGTTNNCASYVKNGQTFQGTLDGVNCFYGTDFVSLTNPLEDIANPVTFADLPNSGVHVFSESLVVGRAYSSDAELAAAGISEGGDGAVINIEGGATLAFNQSDDYMVINRGSQIFAQGSEGNPVTITSVSDAIEGDVDPEDVQQWGGMIINGFGVTNKCAYQGNRGDANLSTSDCHVAAEGKAGAGQSFYGGDNDADSSGVLNYFIVKHTGAQVAPDNELNGISFNAVGSGTQVDYIQAYSTYDDGIEFFGGAVDVGHYIGMYVRDDSIDIDEGYIGTLDYALVIQSETDGNRCIESDGIGSYSSQSEEAKADFIARGLNSAATIRNLTCIVSPTQVSGKQDINGADGTGTHEEGQGWRIREAHYVTIENAILTTAYMADQAPDDDNYCVRIDNEGEQAALDGDLVIASSIVACADTSDGDTLADSGTTQEQFLTDNGNLVYASDVAGEDPTSASNANLEILSSFYSLPLADMVVNGAAVNLTPTSGRPYIGAVAADDDWTANWAYGLDPTNRGQPLWFE